MAICDYISVKPGMFVTTTEERLPFNNRQAVTCYTTVGPEYKSDIIPAVSVLKAPAPIRNLFHI